MINLKTVQQIEKAPIEERLEIIELLLRSLKKDMATRTRPTPQKRFRIRQFDLGQEVHVDREELYADRGL